MLIWRPLVEASLPNSMLKRSSRNASTNGRQMSMAAFEANYPHALGRWPGRGVDSTFPMAERTHEKAWSATSRAAGFY